MKNPLILICLLCSFLISCTGKHDRDLKISIHGKEMTLERDETLIINNGVFFPHFDWNRASLARSLLPIHNIMEGMVTYDFSDKKSPIRPALAKSWTKLQNGKIWEFKLRKNLKWSDGKELEAQHFLDHIFFQLDPKKGFRGVQILFALKNAEAYYKGEVQKEDVGIKIVNERTIQYTLEKPSSQFPSYMVLTSYLPMRLDFVEKHLEDWGTQLDLPVTGPFKPLYISNSGEVYLERNDKFYGKSPQFKYIKILTVEDQETAARLFSQKNLDINFEVPHHLIRKKHTSIMSRTSFAVLVVAFNLENPYFKDFEVRQSLAEGTNRSELIKALGPDFIAYRSLYPSIAKGSELIPKIEEKIRPKVIKKLNNKGLKISTWKIPFCESAAENIQHQWKKNLGLDLEIEINPHKVMLAKQKSLDFDLAILPFTSMVEDPSFIMKYIEFAAYGAEAPKEVLNAIESANQAENFQQRMLWFKKADRMFQERLPSFPLLMLKKSAQVQKYVKNYHLGNFGYYPMKNIELSR